MRIIASVEARMGSSRFPGKVLADIHGKPAMSRLIKRLQQCKMLHGIVIATSTAPADDALEKWSSAEGVFCFRGSEEDVLSRVVKAHKMMDSDIIVEVTGDCILLDPQLIDWGITTFLENDCDVVTNARKLSFPMGEDIQVFRRKDLEEIERSVDDPAVREHVSLYFYEHPEKYRIIHLFAPSIWYGPNYRFQLDYNEDHQFINEVYRLLEPEFGETFGIGEIMDLLKRNPSLLDINRHCIEKSAR